MGCCCRINTEQLLANFFAKFDEDRAVSGEEIRQYLDYLSSVFPVYVTSDLDYDLIEWCTEEYPELYTLVERSEGKILIHRTNGIPNLHYFNECFNTEYASFIERMTTHYFEKKVKQDG